MAYSNWGAFVHKDGERRTDREDVAVFGDDEKDLPSGVRIFANIMANRQKFPDGQVPPHEHSHHAVLGDGPVRLTGYKNSPRLWHVEDDGSVAQVDLTPFRTTDGDPWDDHTYEGEYAGAHFRANQYDGNMIDLELVEADGAKWTSTCGYCYGAGFEDE